MYSMHQAVHIFIFTFFVTNYNMYIEILSNLFYQLARSNSASLTLMIQATQALYLGYSILSQVHLLQRPRTTPVNYVPFALVTE